eukprot:symbB.v1.2.004016.t1/scaffold227.1/size261201/2
MFLCSRSASVSSASNFAPFASTMSKHATLIFSRHGESEWNVANIFTGWVDVDLSEKGLGEAKGAGELLKAEGFEIDVAYTSFLKRAIKTCNLALEAADQYYVPVNKTWRLNERMYGGLTGLDKKETVKKHGADQVISARFAERAEHQLLDFYNEMKDVREATRTQVRKIPFTTATRACRAARKAILEEDNPQWKQEPFKLSKFKRVRAKVTSFRQKSEAAEILDLDIAAQINEEEPRQQNPSNLCDTLVTSWVFQVKNGQ